MVTMDDQQLERRIREFWARKKEKFPELERIDAKHQPSNLLTRLQDMVTTFTHTSQPRHTH